MRSPERADAATGERAAALARELVEQLGQMRGAAMKVGQVLSTIDFSALPEDERESFKQTLAQLRDDVPPLPFKRLEKLLREELGEKPSAIFAEFEEEAFAAASIGQVHRAVTLEGQRGRGQGPVPGRGRGGRHRPAQPHAPAPARQRLAPGLDVKALYAELRERIAEELDYELEAQNQRAVARAHRGHPFAYVPEVFTELSSRRVLVTELISGARFEEVKQRDEATRDRFGEIVFRFYFGLVHYMRRVSGDPHPGNYLLLDDGRIGFLDFGLMRVLDERATWRARRRSRRRWTRRDSAGRPRRAEPSAATCPSRTRSCPRTCTPRSRAWARGTSSRASAASARSGWPSCSTRRAARARRSSPRCAARRCRRRRCCMRRMEGLVLSTLGELRASADWNAIAREYYAARAGVHAAGRGGARVLGAQRRLNRRSITSTASGDSSISR